MISVDGVLVIIILISNYGKFAYTQNIASNLTVREPAHKHKANVTARHTRGAESVASQTGTSKREEMQVSAADQSSDDTTGLARQRAEERPALAAWHI